MAPMEGSWYYNQGASFYAIFPHEGKVVYLQTLPNGRTVMGEVTPLAGVDGWSHESQLSNGAKIRLQLQGGGDQMMTTYQRAGTSEWRSTTVAQRGSDQSAPQPQAERPREEEKRPDTDGELYTRAEFVQFYGGTQQWDGALAVSKHGGKASKKGRGEPQLKACPEMFRHFVRRVVLGSVIGDEIGEDLPLAGPALQHMAINHVPGAFDAPVKVFHRVMAPPMANAIEEASLEDHQQEVAEAKKRNPKQHIVPVPSVRLIKDLAHPVSYNEEQMLRLFVGDPRNKAYNLCQTLRMQAPLDAKGLKTCMTLILKRHDVLRSAFRFDSANNPVRKVELEHQGGGYVLCMKDQGDCQMMVGLDSSCTCALGIAPMRWMVQPSHNGLPNFGINLHHIVADADGMMLFCEEAMTLSTYLGIGYSEEAAEAAMPKLPVQFVDFSYWQKSLEAQGFLDPELNYWYREIGSSHPPVLLDVPIDIPRPRVWVAVGASKRVMLDQSLLMPLVHGRATPFAIVLTAFGILLNRHSGCEFVNMAIPFALRNLPALNKLIGNFLNMMPCRITYGKDEPFQDILLRGATSAIDVQRYALAPFLQLVAATQKHYPTTDPSRNPVYATMLDLVPNESEESSNGLSGVLDVFAFVNTKQGSIWCCDFVYNTLILEEQSVCAMMLQLPAIVHAAVRGPKEPIPRALPTAELAQAVGPSESNLDLGRVMVKVGLLPHIIVLKSGWEAEGGTREYYSVRNSRRFKAHSGLELGADYPPDSLKSMRPPGPAKPEPKAKPKAVVPQEEGAPPPQAKLPVVAAVDVEKEAEAKKAELTRRRQRSYKIAALWAESQRVSECIPLDEADGFNEPPPVQHRHRGLAGRGRAR